MKNRKRFLFLGALILSNFALADAQTKKKVDILVVAELKESGDHISGAEALGEGWVGGEDEHTYKKSFLVRELPWKISTGDLSLSIGATGKVRLEWEVNDNGHIAEMTLPPDLVSCASGLLLKEPFILESRGHDNSTFNFEGKLKLWIRPAKD